MKKVFLVRKDTTMPYGEGNWQMMNVAEFKKFKQTDQAKGRCFTRLFQQDQDSDLIIKECEPDEARKIKPALQKVRRNQEYASKKGIIEIPYSQVNVDGELVSSEELIADETQDVEEIVNKKMMMESLHKAIARLTEEERKVVELCYLNNEVLSDRKVCVELGLSRTTFQRRKAEILKKLKNLCNYVGH